MFSILKLMVYLFTTLEIVRSEFCRRSLTGPSGTVNFPPKGRPARVPQFALRGDNATTDCLYYRNTGMKTFVIKFRNVSLATSEAQIKTIKQNPNANWKVLRRLSGEFSERVVTIRGVRFVKIVVKKDAGFFTIDYKAQIPPVIKCRSPLEPVKILKCSKGQNAGSKCTLTCIEGFSMNQFLESKMVPNFIANCKKVTRKSARWKPVLNKSICGQKRRIKKECRKQFEFCVPVKNATIHSENVVLTALQKQRIASTIQPSTASLPNKKLKRRRGYFRRRQNAVSTSSATATTPKSAGTGIITTSLFSATAKSSLPARPKRRRKSRRRKTRVTTTVKPSTVPAVILSATHPELATDTPISVGPRKRKKFRRRRIQKPKETTTKTYPKFQTLSEEAATPGEKSHLTSNSTTRTFTSETDRLTIISTKKIESTTIRTTTINAGIAKDNPVSSLDKIPTTAERLMSTGTVENDFTTKKDLQSNHSSVGKGIATPTFNSTASVAQISEIESVTNRYLNSINKIKSRDRTTSARTQPTVVTDSMLSASEKSNFEREAQTYASGLIPFIQKPKSFESSIRTPASVQGDATTSLPNPHSFGGTTPFVSQQETQSKIRSATTPSKSAPSSYPVDFFLTRQPELKFALSTSQPEPTISLTNYTAPWSSKPKRNFPINNNNVPLTSEPMTMVVTTGNISLSRSQTESSQGRTDEPSISVTRPDSNPFASTSAESITIANSEPEPTSSNDQQRSTSQLRPEPTVTDNQLILTAEPAPSSTPALSMQQLTTESSVNLNSPAAKRIISQPPGAITFPTEARTLTTETLARITSPKTNPTTIPKPPTTTTARNKATSPGNKSFKDSMVSIGRTTTTIAHPIVYSGPYFVFIRPLVLSTSQSTTTTPTTQSVTPTSVAGKVKPLKIRVSTPLGLKICKSFCKINAFTMRYSKSCSDFRGPGRTAFCRKCRYSPSKPCSKYSKLV